jgi:glyoxylase-like metal-dependent hydrolase (beta-lactamase superfamily II)
MQALEVSDSLVWWTARHPAWTPNPEWPEQVGFAAWRASNAYALIDPLIRDDLDDAAWEPFDVAVAETGDPVVVLLTAPWHERSARAVSARYNAAVWIHPRGKARIAGLPELTALPDGIEVFVPDGVEEAQVAFHIVPEQVLVVAEFLLGTDDGLRVLPSPATRDLDAFLASLDRLRDLPIERVLVSHGPSVLSDGSVALCEALDNYARSRG